MSNEWRAKNLAEFNRIARAKAEVAIGTRFATMVVVGRFRRDGCTKYQVVCDCGVHKEIEKSSLIRSKSCGCLTNKIIAKARTRHGETDSPTWKSWKSMLDRCELVAHKSYHDYGGRGITVCQSWHRYENFVADMGHRPAGTQLDRIDNSRGYEPSNCRWATPRQNCNNRRNSIVIEHDGERLTLAQWGRRFAGKEATFRKRIEMGWPIAVALTRSVRGSTKAETLQA